MILLTEISVDHVCTLFARHVLSVIINGRSRCVSAADVARFLFSRNTFGTGQCNGSPINWIILNAKNRQIYLLVDASIRR